MDIMVETSPLPALKCFFSSGRNTPKLRGRPVKWLLFTLSHLLSPVHHTVPDDVPHEAGKDGHPSPESSIRCRWRRHCCVCKWVLWLRLEAGRETQAEVFHQALTTLHCQLVQLSLTRSSLSSVTLWQTCSVWSISIIIHYNDDRQVLMFVTINFVRVEIHLPAPKITMQYKNWIDNRIIIHIISI